MLGLTFGLVLLATGANEYDAAYRQMQNTGKPLVVLIGAEWCPGCRTMKNLTMPALARGGDLDSVAYAEINYDRQTSLARRLMRGGTIPQLIVFAKTPTGWKRMQMTGSQAAQTVRAAIQRAKELQNQEPAEDAAASR